MLELKLQFDYETLAREDPLQITIKDPAILGDLDPKRVHASQYISLIEGYVTREIISDDPETNQSIIAGGRFSLTSLESPQLKARFYTRNRIAVLELRYRPEKASLISRIKHLYNIFTRLAASAFVPTELPPDARLAHAFTSRYSRFLLFDASANATYIQFTKNNRTLTYRLTRQYAAFPLPV